MGRGEEQGRDTGEERERPAMLPASLHHSSSCWTWASLASRVAREEWREACLADTNRLSRLARSLQGGREGQEGRRGKGILFSEKEGRREREYCMMPGT